MKKKLSKFNFFYLISLCMNPVDALKKETEIMYFQSKSTSLCN